MTGSGASESNVLKARSTGRLALVWSAAALLVGRAMLAALPKGDDKIGKPPKKPFPGKPVKPKEEGVNAQPAPPLDKPQGHYIMVKVGADVHLGQGAGYPVIGEVQSSSRVYLKSRRRLIGRRGDWAWLEIEFRSQYGDRGWINCQLAEGYKTDYLTVRPYSPGAGPTKLIARVHDHDVRIRKGPGTAHEPMGKVHTDWRLPVRGRTDDESNHGWTAVEYNGLAWINNEFVIIEPRA